jgi:uncharacterized protein (TIGR02646 family)
MRYIDKTKPCLEFEQFLTDFGQRLHGNDWEKVKKVTYKDKNGDRIPIGRNVLLTLFQHLRVEQKSLCIYCQQLIPEKTEQNTTTYQYAHFEHVNKQEQHQELVFKQENLSVSCNGFDNDIAELDDNAKIKEFCGHFKDGNYNPTTFNPQLFLNPLAIKDIEQYFIYEFSDDDTEIFIVPNADAPKEAQQKADFMIQLLGLQHKTLCEMRRRQYDIIQEQITDGTSRDSREGGGFSDWFSEDYDALPAFYSMLKEKFL